MYRTFFYIMLLVLVVVAHCILIWHGEKGRKDRKPWSKGTKAFLGVLGGVCVGLILAGLAVVIAHLEPTASHALGGMALLMAVWFDFRLGRACGK